MNMKDLNQLFQDGFIWVFTGVSAFLAISTWNMSMSIRELTTEVKHLTQQNARYDNQFKTINNRFDTISTSIQNLSHTVQVNTQNDIYINNNRERLEKLEERLGVLEREN